MWWRLGVLAAVTGALVFFVIAPIFTVSIHVDLPPGIPPPAPASDETETFVRAMIWVTEGVFVAVILAVAGWIAWRIVRRHRDSN